MDVLGYLIKGLATFEVVTVTVVTRPESGDEKVPHPWYQRIFRVRNKRPYEIFRQEWEGALGRAEFHDSFEQEGAYLEFRPRARVAAAGFVEIPAPAPRLITLPL